MNESKTVINALGKDRSPSVRAMALILLQINGFENAMEFARKINSPRQLSFLDEMPNAKDQTAGALPVREA